MTKPLPDTLYKYVVRNSVRSQIFLTLISICVFGLSFAPLELQRQIINAAVRGDALDQLLVFSAIFLAIVLVQGGLKYFMNVLRGRISEKAIRHIRLLVRDHVKKDSTDQDDAGTAVSLVSAEVEPLGGFIGESISSPIVQAGSLVTVLAYLTWVEPLMALVAVVVFTPAIIFIPPLQAAINRRAKKRIEDLREIGDLITSSDEGTNSDNEKNGFSELVDRIFKLRMSIFRIKFSMKFLINLMNSLGIIGILFVGGYLVIQGETEAGTIVAFLSGLKQISEPGRMLVSFYRQLTDAKVRYKLIHDFF